MVNEDLYKLKIDKSQEQPRFSRRKNRLVGLVVLLLLLGGGVWFGKGFFSPTILVEAVTVAKVYPSQAFTLLNASGYVVAQRKSAVASKVTGRLMSLLVEEGSRIKKGEIIARLENDDVLAARDQAEANLSQARFNLEQAQAELHDATLSYQRNRSLLGQDYVSQSDYDASEARYKKAVAALSAAQAAVRSNEAGLQGAKVALDYTVIRAPFDAVVLTKNADLGDIVTPVSAAANAKAAVVTVADLNSLQVEVDVSESNLELVKKDQPCEIQLDALPESRFRGQVHMIVPTADRTKATVLVKIRFLDQDPRILPEMSAKVAFLSRPVQTGEERPRTAVSREAVLSRKGKNTVFLIQGDRVVDTPIVLGARFGDMVEVLQGIDVGDRIVLKPPIKLKSGSKVRTAES